MTVGNNDIIQVTEWEDAVKNEQEEKLDISADMVRQYKTMQSTMALRIHLLETNLSHMQVIGSRFFGVLL
jgi:hypothetical protein